MYNIPPAPVISLDKAEALRRNIAHLFFVSDTTLDLPEPGFVRFRGRFLQDSADCFDELRHLFEQQGFTPVLRQEDDRVALVAMPGVFDPPPSNWLINLVLFLATVLTTLLIGAAYEGASLDEGWRALLQGWPYSVSIMLILGAHELGHYFAARYHREPVTLPYFIPVPTIIGTMGAFIRLKAPVKNRRALLDIGVAGPLMGMVFALPILLYGLATSSVGPIGVPEPGQQILMEGNSILYILLKLLVFGRFLPSDGIDVQLNSIAWAGWVGLLVTGLNLIPVGQLDGGHIAYVLFGKKARQLFWPVIIGLVALVLVTQTLMWGIWIVLLYFLGRSHAQPLDDVTPLDSRRRAIAILTLCLFVLVFTPIPIQELTAVP
jgi:membrane-associated protease RseP (regulator of RpoE activity)